MTSISGSILSAAIAPPPFPTCSSPAEAERNDLMLEAAAVSGRAVISDDKRERFKGRVDIHRGGRIAREGKDRSRGIKSRTTLQ